LHHEKEFGKKFPLLVHADADKFSCKGLFKDEPLTYGLEMYGKYLCDFEDGCICKKVFVALHGQVRGDLSFILEIRVAVYCR
jgi:hypothetical protein